GISGSQVAADRSRIGTPSTSGSTVFDESDIVEPRQATQTSKTIVFRGATVNRMAQMKKRCAFNVGTVPCGWGVEEKIATLQSGDRVKVLSRRVRAKDGSDVYEIRTQEGWQGWITDNCLTADGPTRVVPASSRRGASN